MAESSSSEVEHVPPPSAVVFNALRTELSQPTVQVRTIINQFSQLSTRRPDMADMTALYVVQQLHKYAAPTTDSERGPNQVISLTQEVIGEMLNAHAQRDEETILSLLPLAAKLGFVDPNMSNFIKAVKEQYEIKPAYSPKPTTGKGLGRRAAVTGVLGFGGAAIGTGRFLPTLIAGNQSVAPTGGSDVFLPLSTPTSESVPPLPTSSSAVTSSSEATTDDQDMQNQLEADKALKLQEKKLTPVPTATATKTPTPVPTPTAEPSPTPDVKVEAKEKVKNANAIEYFVGDLLRTFQERRRTRFKDDKYFRERMGAGEAATAESKQQAEKLINSNWMNFVFMGLDTTRERKNDFNDKGYGRSDVLMVMSFNPHTFQMFALSIPRDLYCPEMNPYFGQNARVNYVPMLPLVDKTANPFDKMKGVIETATGLPIDFVVNTNIDFMQGATNDNEQFMPGIFDRLFPNGLKIPIENSFTDPNYPIGYSTETVSFQGGQDEVMKGGRITQYARSRHGDSDFGRADRQRQILLAAMKQLMPRIMDDFKRGDTTTLNLFTQVMQEQTQWHNLFVSDINPIVFFKKIAGSVSTLSKDKLGGWILANLTLNSVVPMSEFLKDKQDSFISYGLTTDPARNELVSGANPSDQYQLSFAQSNRNAPPTALGQYMDYWKPLRDRVQKLLPQS